MKKNLPVYFPHAGADLLDMSLYNKGNAFSLTERREFNLDGLLPHRVESIDEQLTRSYERLMQLNTDLDRHIFLRDLQDTNETLFYRLVSNNLVQILPLIYTPTVGKACELFSQIYRQRRGLFLSYPNRANLADQIWNVSSKKIKVIVITDGERILGLGDLGTGGMGIPIGKLSIYTACGGISPAYTLPIYVDVGTNNQKLLNDPMYIGWQHPRIDDTEYYSYLDQIMTSLNERWPGVMIQFEDFAQKRATPLLNEYRHKYCCFNDDIQGTAAVTLGTLQGACRKVKSPLKEQLILFSGAGSAATGIANLAAYQMTKEGLSLEEARSRIYLCNSKGLLCEASPVINDFQRDYVKQSAEVKKISDNPIPSLAECVAKLKPTVLIGVSGQPGNFTESIVKEMAKNNKIPIIFPLSNPTSKAEALPEDIIKWTAGRAVVATGSPFEPFTYQGQEHIFSQCNNCFVFPGIGLAVVASNLSCITDDMLLTAAETLTDYNANRQGGGLLPDISEVPQISRAIAFNVIKQAMAKNLTLSADDATIKARIERNFWEPIYREYRRTAF